jgi:hypothetical protein
MSERTYHCRNCHEAEQFHGWDECLACGVAECLVEQPEYLDFARRVFADQSEWLAQLETEWARQSSALAAFPEMRIPAERAS